MTMKNFRESFMRLLILAEHLRQVQGMDARDWNFHFFSVHRRILSLSDKVEGYCTYSYVYNALATQFSEWERIPSCEVIVYKPNRELDLDLAMMDFFGIDIVQWHHCFIPGYQNVEVYGGKKLWPKSQPKSVAQNIYDLLSWELDQFCNT